MSKWTILGNDGVAGSDREPTNGDEPAEDAAEAAEALLAAESGLASYEGVSVILSAGRTSSPDFLRIIGDLAPPTDIVYGAGLPSLTNVLVAWSYFGRPRMSRLSRRAEMASDSATGEPPPEAMLAAVMEASVGRPLASRRELNEFAPGRRS